MASLLDLSEMEHEDAEYVPEIVPVDAKLSVRGEVKSLIGLFARAAAVSPQKEVIPGTAYAKLEAFRETSSTAAFVRITASDGDQTISVNLDGVHVLMEGSALLPAKRISDILKLAPAQFVKIEVIGNTATIRSGRALWTVQTPVGDYMNSLLDVAEAEMQVLEVVPFIRALLVARTAASNSEARTSLMQLHVKDGTITGCDGGRLHRSAVKGLDPSVETTIPIQVADELIKALRPHIGSSLSFGYTDRFLIFHIGDDRIVAQRLLTPFPEVESLILGPALSNTYKLRINRRDLITTVTRVRVNADPEFAVITLSLVQNGTTDSGEKIWNLAARAKDKQGNTSQEVLECVWTGSKTAELRFNHHYLTEILSIYPDEYVNLLVSDDTKTMKAPILIENKEAGISGVVQQVSSIWM